jgi:MFS family permease
MAREKSALWQNRSFLWLMSGGVLSMLGDQFTVIALPWLVLKMTGDSLLVGTALAATGIPRAIFIIFGGVLVDRTSSQRVLLVTKYINAILLGALAFLVYADLAAVWSIIAMALAIGLTSAFSYPAGTAILPQVVATELLQPANGVLMGMRQINQLIGPSLAGLVISLFGDASLGLGIGAAGVAAAFLFDSLTFLISAFTLAKVRLRPFERSAGIATGVWGDIKEGVGAMWQDKPLRALCLYYAATAFLIGGPIQVAMPLLAERNLPDGAAGFGAIMAIHGLGALLGMVISGAKPKWRVGSLGTTILLVDAVAGLVFLPLGLVHDLWQAAILLLPLGALAGFIQVLAFSWMQSRVPPAMMGRAMSVFMFIFMGLAPLSGPLAGWVMRYLSLPQLFAGTGCLFFLIVLMGWSWGRIATVGKALEAAAA